MFGSLHWPVCFLMYFLPSFLLGCMYTSLCLRLSGRYGREGNHRHVCQSYERGWCRSTSGHRPGSFIQQPAGYLFHAGAAEPAVVFVNSQWRRFRFRLRRRAVSGESRSSSAAGYQPSDSQLHPTSGIAGRLQHAVVAIVIPSVSIARRRHVDLAAASRHLVVRHCVRCRSVDTWNCRPLRARCVRPPHCRVASTHWRRLCMY